MTFKRAVPPSPSANPPKPVLAKEAEKRESIQSRDIAPGAIKSWHLQNNTLVGREKLEKGSVPFWAIEKMPPGTVLGVPAGSFGGEAVAIPITDIAAGGTLARLSDNGGGSYTFTNGVDAPVNFASASPVPAVNETFALLTGNLRFVGQSGAPQLVSVASLVSTDINNALGTGADNLLFVAEPVDETFVLTGANLTFTGQTGAPQTVAATDLLSSDANNAAVAGLDFLINVPIAAGTDLPAGTAGLLLAASHVIDQDDMLSNSDQHVPTQQSVKTYVDSRVAVVNAANAAAKAAIEAGLIVSDRVLIYQQDTEELSLWTGASSVAVELKDTLAFLSELTVAPASAGQPTEVELAAAIGSVIGNNTNRIFRYTGTNTSTDATTYLAYVDRVGTVVKWPAAAGASINYVNTNLTATADRTHTWSTFNLAEIFSTGTQSRAFTDGVNSALVSEAATGIGIDAGNATTAAGLDVTADNIDLSFGVASDLKINGVSGLAGEMPQSTGPNLPPVWALPGKARIFADNTTVAPAVPGAPTNAEIATFAGTNRDTVIYYTGTDTSTDAEVYVYHIDTAGAVTTILRPAPSVSPYVHPFVSGAWSAPALGLRSITITAVTHGRGLYPTPRMFSGAGPFIEVYPTELSVAANGDVTVSINDGDEFSGRFVI